MSVQGKANKLSRKLLLSFMDSSGFKKIKTPISEDVARLAIYAEACRQITENKAHIAEATTLIYQQAPDQLGPLLEAAKSFVFEKKPVLKDVFSIQERSREKTTDDIIREAQERLAAKEKEQLSRFRPAARARLY